MTIARVRAVAGLIVAALAAACGASDGGPAYATTVDSATAAEFASEAGNYARQITKALVSGYPAVDAFAILGHSQGASPTKYAANVIQFLRGQAYARAHMTAPTGSPLAAAPHLSAPFSTCTPVVTGIGTDGTPIDVDGDGVPDDFLVAFPAGCVDSDSTGTPITTYSGSIHIRDLMGLYAYRIDVTDLRVKGTTLATGDFEQLALNGFETAAYASTGISHQIDMTYDISLGGDGASAENVLFVYRETSAYAPDGAIALTDPVPSGDLTFTFDYRILASIPPAPAQNHRFLMHTSTVLHYDATTCFGINSGVIHGLLNGESDVGFDIAWTKCGMYDVTTFGTTETTD
jgi:hypothetical protein